jgi:tRNA-2-methylthio-N6-dimethylallyladenosine synthase
MPQNIDPLKVYIETYGCQMNLNDSEIVLSVMKDAAYSITEDPVKADIIFLNTCSVRENAENTIYNRLIHLKQYKKQRNKLVVGILGCMAERLQSQLIEQKDIVSLVIGPDEYRNLPALVERAMDGEKGIAVKLSTVETYNDIEPFRTNGISAWLSISRGCNNFCSYCVVPYTRGRERSRPFKSIIREVENLYKNGYKEVTLLGQNVNSYKDDNIGSDFADLLDACSKSAPEMRIRFVTSHPKDMSDKLLEIMASHKNICKYIHLPIQSGSDKILKLMRRKYTTEHYLGRINKIREFMPDCAITTDIIAGYPSETIEDHMATLDLMKTVRYDGAFMFKYSPREGTKAYDFPDDVPEEEKLRRLNEIIELQNNIAKEKNKSEIGKIHEVLAESPSKRNKSEWQGRSDTNKIVIFPNEEFKYKTGDFINVRIKRSTSATLFGEVVE